MVSQWFLTMFSYTIPTSLTLVVWDFIFYGGWPAMFRIALSKHLVSSRNIIFIKGDRPRGDRSHDERLEEIRHEHRFLTRGRWRRYHGAGQAHGCHWRGFTATAWVVCDGDDLNVRVIDKFWSKWYELILLFCFMWLSSRMASPSRWLMIASHRNESMNTCVH